MYLRRSRNNGADALAVGRMLIEQGYNVEIFLFNIFGKLSDECAYNRKRLLEIDNADFTEVVGGNFQPPDLSSDVVVLDGLFGSGLREPLTVASSRWLATSMHRRLMSCRLMCLRDCLASGMKMC